MEGAHVHRPTEHYRIYSYNQAVTQTLATSQGDDGGPVTRGQKCKHLLRRSLCGAPF